MEGAAPAREPVIGHDDERRPLRDPGQRLADDPVELLVDLLHGVGELRVLGLVGGVAGVHGPPHHVGDEIAVAEVVEEQSVLEAVEHVAVLP